MEFPTEPHNFIHEFLEENQQPFFFSETCVSLQDWIKAYALMKNEGDFTRIEGPFMTPYQAYLFKSWIERTNDCLKVEN